MPVPEGTSEKLKIAWENAWSVPPGERPHGDYIGKIQTVHHTYYFYQDHDKYWYETEYDRQQAETLARVKRQKWENRRKYGYYGRYG